MQYSQPRVLNAYYTGFFLAQQDAAAYRNCLFAKVTPRAVRSFGRPRSLSEKQVKVDKDLRRAAAERFFVFRGIPHFVPGGEIRKSLLEFGLILGQPPRTNLSSEFARRDSGQAKTSPGASRLGRWAPLASSPHDQAIVGKGADASPSNLLRSAPSTRLR